MSNQLAAILVAITGCIASVGVVVFCSTQPLNKQEDFTALLAYALVLNALMQLLYTRTAAMIGNVGMLLGLAAVIGSGIFNLIHKTCADLCTATFCGYVIAYLCHIYLTISTSCEIKM